MTITKNSPIIFHRNVDDNGDPISIAISNEPLTIFDNKGYLNQVPDKYNRVSIYDAVEGDMYEVDIRSEITEENQYKVPYGTERLVYVHPNKEGKVLNATYFGKGFIRIPADNIAVEFDSSGNVTETLKDIINTGAMNWQIPVATYADIATTYPSPEESWTVETTSDGKIYRYNGTTWGYAQQLIKGDNGDSATITVGTVTSGITASVTNSGTTSAAIFDFVLPKGDQGESGNDGETPNITIGTVTTVSNTTPASAEITGTTPNLVLNMSIPKGADGTGAGDMLKSTYDIDNDGIVDNSEALNGQSASYYLSRTNHTGTQTANTISDFTSAAQTAAPAETTTTIGTLINGATAKTTPVDADMVGLMDSADSNVIKKFSWANIKSAILSIALTGLSTATSTVVTATDSILVAIGKLQAQMTLRATLSSPIFTGTVILPSTTSIGNVSSTEIGYVDGVTSAIQTQLNGKLADIVNDTTPQLGGELDQNAHSIGNTETDNGNSGTAKTIDWRNGNHQKVIMTGNCTFTFIAPTKACMLSLRIINDATAGRTKVFPTIKYPGGTAPTWSTTANAIDILSLYYDGTAYYGQAGLSFA